MKLFTYLKSLINKGLQKNPPIASAPEKDIKQPVLTVSQAAHKNGVTRQAIFFAIKMKRLEARKDNGTWLITESALKEYHENKYSRSISRKEGELIFDKNKGFYSIAEAAKFLNKKTNHIYYLVRMGILKSHREGYSIVINHIELCKYAEFANKNSHENLRAG